MTPFTLSHPDHMRLQRQGWMCSVLFHAIMGACALALLSGLQLPLQQDQFRWNVAMVEPPKPQQKVDAPSETTPQPAPPKPQIARTQPPKSQPIVEPVQRRLIQPVQAVQQVVQRQVTTVNQTASVITQAVHHSETSKTVAPTTTREAIVQEEQIVATTAAVPQQTTAPVETESLVSHQPAEPVVERAVTEPAGKAAVEQTVAQVLLTKTLPATKADYGWLMRTLLSRVNQLKNYPHMARINHWEGKVVLRAVIKDDGQVLMVDIQESSGRPILDNDAIETLRRASPLKLEHPLGKPQVAILMPISYSLR